MTELKQSTAHTRSFLMIDSADHLTGKTALTVTVTVAKNGGAFAAAGGAVSEIGNGWYKVAFTATDTNTLGDLSVHCTATGADPTDFLDNVVAYDPYDAVALGLSRLDASISTVASQVWGFATRTLSAFGFSVTVGTNNDKTGYALANPPLTAPQAALAVWGELIPGTYAAGSAAQRLNSAASAGDPWATQVPGPYAVGTAGNIVGTRLDAKVSSVSGGGGGGTSAGLIGAGSIQYTATVTKPNSSTPLEGVACWVTTDQAGTNVIAGTLYTNTNGQVIFMLDAGTYYLWRQLSGFNFTNPTSFTVS